MITPFKCSTNNNHSEIIWAYSTRDAAEKFAANIYNINQFNSLDVAISEANNNVSNSTIHYRIIVSIKPQFNAYVNVNPTATTKPNFNP